MLPYLSTGSLSFVTPSTCVPSFPLPSSPLPLLFLYIFISPFRNIPLLSLSSFQSSFFSILIFRLLFHFYSYPFSLPFTFSTLPHFSFPILLIFFSIYTHTSLCRSDSPFPHVLLFHPLHPLFPSLLNSPDFPPLRASTSLLFLFFPRFPSLPFPPGL